VGPAGTEAMKVTWQILRMWWPGAKISGVVIAICYLWYLLGIGYALVAGWMPEPMYTTIAILLSIVLAPIFIYAGVADVLKLRE
jgi:hypothetical protein